MSYVRRGQHGFLFSDKDVAMPETTEQTNARMWPFTIRISREERRLLMVAARRDNTSKAEIARLGLNPLFARLSNEIDRKSVGL